MTKKSSRNDYSTKDIKQGKQDAMAKAQDAFLGANQCSSSMDSGTTDGIAEKAKTINPGKVIKEMPRVHMSLRQRKSQAATSPNKQLNPNSQAEHVVKSQASVGAGDGSNEATSNRVHEQSKRTYKREQEPSKNYGKSRAPTYIKPDSKPQPAPLKPKYNVTENSKPATAPSNKTSLQSTAPVSSINKEAKTTFGEQTTAPESKSNDDNFAAQPQTPNDASDVSSDSRDQKDSEPRQARDMMLFPSGVLKKARTFLSSIRKKKDK